jgi:hypothetical protein
MQARVDAATVGRIPGCRDDSADKDRNSGGRLGIGQDLSSSGPIRQAVIPKSRQPVHKHMTTYTDATSHNRLARPRELDLPGASGWRGGSCDPVGEPATRQVNVIRSAGTGGQRGASLRVDRTASGETTVPTMVGP